MLEAMSQETNTLSYFLKPTEYFHKVGWWRLAIFLESGLFDVDLGRAVRLDSWSVESGNGSFRRPEQHPLDFRPCAISTGCQERTHPGNDQCDCRKGKSAFLLVSHGHASACSVLCYVASSQNRWSLSRDSVVNFHRLDFTAFLELKRTKDSANITALPSHTGCQLLPSSSSIRTKPMDGPGIAALGVQQMYMCSKHCLR